MVNTAENYSNTIQNQNVALNTISKNTANVSGFHIETESDITEKINNISEKNDSTELDSPYISHVVKECLPSFMQEILSYMDSEREKDIFIIGILTVISGIIDSQRIYNRKKIILQCIRLSLLLLPQ